MVNQVFEKNLQANGYSLGLLYADFREEDQSRMIAECNADDVAGVIIFGTEFKQETVRCLTESENVGDLRCGAGY